MAPAASIQIAARNIFFRLQLEIGIGFAKVGNIPVTETLSVLKGIQHDYEHASNQPNEIGPPTDDRRSLL
jgi:hypothetical protein